MSENRAPPETAPRPPEPPLILVAGATGFVGRELVRALSLKGYRVRATTRQVESAKRLLGNRIEVVLADWVTGQGTEGVARRVRIAYYLVHSLGGRPDFAEADRAAATRFTDEMGRAGVERIVYLGG